MLLGYLRMLFVDATHFQIFKCNSLYFKFKEPMQNNVDREKNNRQKMKEIKRIRKRREWV